MSDTRVLIEFKNNLINFFDEVISQFPEEGDLIIIRIFLNDQIPIKEVMDEFILKNVENILERKFKYYKPNEFLNKTRFQLVSNDHDDNFRKLGDPGGYCLAWCLWYVELKLCNPNIDELKLIIIASKKILYCSP